MRSLLSFAVLYSAKIFSRLFFRHRIEWVHQLDPDKDHWAGHRVCIILNHTSLFEFLWAGSPPARFLWQIARHGVIPVAEVTTRRPIVGKFFQLIAQNVVAISRERDHTWRQVLSSINDPESIIVLAPEGRMMRRDGLDKKGRPMTVRGGIADILLAVPEGKLLIAYSTGGLHHVQAPGERWPRLFQTIWLRLESLEIAPYREHFLATAGQRGFKHAVVADLERRRDLYCYPDGKIPPRAPRRRAVTTQEATTQEATTQEATTQEAEANKAAPKAPQ